MNVKMVTQVHEANAVKRNRKKNAETTAILAPKGNCFDENYIHAIVELKGAFGVPVPDDSRLSDVKRRTVRVSLFYDKPVS